MNDADLVQRSDDWLLRRCGSLGASKIRDALSVLKRTGERTKVGEDLVYEIAAERLTHVPARRVNALQWGVEHEDEALAHYSFLTNAPVVKAGFIPHATIPNAHCSPDALVGLDGGLEIKCPTSATHLRTLVEEAVPEDHLPQIHWSMACSGRLWWDFVSYDPRMPVYLQFFVHRVMRDEAMIAAMEADARKFLDELEDKLKAIDARYAEEGT